MNTQNTMAIPTAADKTFIGATFGYFALALASCAGGVIAGFTLLPPALIGATWFLLTMMVVSVALVWTSRTWSVGRFGYLILMLLAAIMGVTLIPLLAYAAAIAGTIIIIKALFATVTMYTGLAIYGYTTGRDLSGLGGFLMAGLIGMISVSLITLLLSFFGFNVWGSQIEMIFSGIGVLLFAGFTAYDFQKIKTLQGQITPIQAAINLFLDFVLLFEYILRLMTALGRR